MNANSSRWPTRCRVPASTWGEVMRATPVLAAGILALCASSSGAAAAPTVDAPPSAAFTPAGTREQLKAQELADGNVHDFVSMQAFAPPAGSLAPSRTLEGRISLGRRSGGAFRVLRNEPFHIPLTDSIKGLPPFDFQFVSDGNQLIPVRRGPVPSPHRDWEWVLEPGRLWNEPGDGGLTRAALPFSLQERNSNCLHNGVLTFLIGPADRISNAYYQISGETCAYFKFDAWGLLQGNYRPGRVVNGAAVISAYRDEVAARLPVRPLAELAQDHPGVLASDFALAPASDGDVPTLYGVVIDGVNYAGNCATRAGEYPYCDVLDLPSYSTAKTIVGAVGLMRLEQLWPGARHALISKYVSECRTRDWEGVTFENVLDMVTGNFDDPGFEVDEMADKVIPFFEFEHHTDRIRFACTAYHRKAPPATRWVYRSTDTYVLGTAMQAYVRARTDRRMDFFDTYERDALWRPLRLSPLMMQTRRSYDSTRQPFTAYGLTYHRDDVARIALFLDRSGGILDGAQLLDRSMLEAALHRDAAQPGWPAGYPGFSYLHGVWSRDLAPLLGCAAPTWAPFLSGYGGNSVVMFPNGVIYYFYSDSWVWDWGPAAVAVNRIKPMCP